jgi:hypothetical protein
VRGLGSIYKKSDLRAYVVLLLVVPGVQVEKGDRSQLACPKLIELIRPSLLHLLGTLPRLTSLPQRNTHTHTPLHMPFPRLNLLLATSLASRF